MEKLHRVDNPPLMEAVRHADVPYNGTVRVRSVDAPRQEVSQPEAVRFDVRALQPVVERLLIAAGTGALMMVAAGSNMGMWLTLAAFVISVVIFARAESERWHALFGILAVTVSVSALVYLGWRAFSVNLVSAWIAVPLFAAEVFGALHLLGFYYTLYPRKSEPIAQDIDPTTLPIYVFVPTVNEGREVLTATLKGAMAARDAYLAQYPHGRVTIVLCNDGRVAGAPDWEDTERLAAELGVECVTRTVKGGAKAGNLEHARHVVGAHGDALIAVFDADQVATADFLLKTVPYFSEMRMGWVQTGQYYWNTENTVARWANDQQAMFYRLLCPGKSPLNAVIICGTNVVIRANALDEIGGLPQDSITEDMAASVTLHRRWRSIFLQDELAHGLGPMDLKSYFAQQRRWSTGNLKIGAQHFKALANPFAGPRPANADGAPADGLRFDQRVQYLLGTSHYLCGVRDFIYIMTPVIYLLFGTSAIDYTSMGQFLSVALPFWVMSHVVFYIVIRGQTGIRGVMINFANFPVYLNSLFTVITGRRLGFQVTSKQRVGRGNLQFIRPHLFFLALCLVAFVVGVQKLPQNPEPIFVSLVWIAYQTFFLSSVIWLAVADGLPKPLRRRIDGIETALKAARMQPFTRIGRSLAAVSSVLVIGGFVFTLTGRAAMPPASPPPALAHSGAGIGLILPYETLDAARDVEQSVIGRTDLIAADFDTAWAEALRETGAIPWVTLAFRDPGAGDAEDFDASPLAIANGLRDADLRRWAAAVRAYGGPMYLTVLPRIDVVAASFDAARFGAQPDDVIRAWTHIQAIFTAEGATNAAWIWVKGALGEPQIDAALRTMADAVIIEMPSLPRNLWVFSGLYGDLPVFVQVARAGQADPAFLPLALDHAAQVDELDVFLFDAGSHFGAGIY
ncbi:MAG: glycosyltransferase [bacterium]|nr:glycosyltransferase [bacterium]